MLKVPCFYCGALHFAGLVILLLHIIDSFFFVFVHIYDAFTVRLCIVLCCAAGTAGSWCKTYVRSVVRIHTHRDSSELGCVASWPNFTFFSSRQSGNRIVLISFGRNEKIVCVARSAIYHAKRRRQLIQLLLPPAQLFPIPADLCIENAARFAITSSVL